MEKFIVVGQNIEHLVGEEIEANTPEEAEEKYLELWEQGMILVNNNETNIQANIIS